VSVSAHLLGNIFGLFGGGRGAAQAAQQATPAGTDKGNQKSKRCRYSRPKLRENRLGHASELHFHLLKEARTMRGGNERSNVDIKNMLQEMM